MLISVFVLPHLLLSLTVKKDDNRTHVLWLLNLHLGWACRDGSHRWSCRGRVAWWVRGSISRMAHAHGSRGCWLSAGMSATHSFSQWSHLKAAWASSQHSIWFQGVFQGIGSCPQGLGPHTGAASFLLYSVGQRCHRAHPDPMGAVCVAPFLSGWGGVSENLWPLASAMWLSC